MKKALIIATIGGFLPVTEINNAKLLQELGYEVHYAANLENKAYDYDKEKLIREGFVLHQVEFSKSPFHFTKLVRCIGKVRRIIEEEQIDLIHCHTPVGGVVGRVSGHLAKNKPRIIYTAHGFHFYKGASILNWLLYYPVEFLLSKWTDCLVTINEEDFLRAQKMLCGKCVKIPGVGIDLKRFQPMVNKQKNQGEGYHIISIGELNKNKNHSTVIKAIASLNDVHIQYDIYGNGPLKCELEELIRSLGLEEQVKLKGFDTEIEKPLANADLLVFPSYREGLGLAALEAMACGVPTIVADNRGTREYAYHEKNSLVCKPDSVADFAEAIRCLKSHPELAYELAETAKVTVNRFRVEETTKIMRAVYEKI